METRTERRRKRGREGGGEGSKLIPEFIYRDNTFRVMNENLHVLHGVFFAVGVYVCKHLCVCVCVRMCAGVGGSRPALLYGAETTGLAGARGTDFYRRGYSEWRREGGGGRLISR